MKMIISATQYNEIYSDNSGVLISKKISADVDYMTEKCEKLKAENSKLREALTLAVESASFFSKFADCTKDSWSCRCEFCIDTKQTKSLAAVRQVLKEFNKGESK